CSFHHVFQGVWKRQLATNVLGNVFTLARRGDEVVCTSRWPDSSSASCLYVLRASDGGLCRSVPLSTEAKLQPSSVAWFGERGLVASIGRSVASGPIIFLAL